MIHNLEISTLNVIRLHTYLAKVLVVVMLWAGLAGPLAVVHARTFDVELTVTKLKHQAEHISKHSEHGHHGGVGHSHDNVPIEDPDCLQFCAELLDTSAVFTVLVERPEIDSGKKLASALTALFPSDTSIVAVTSVSATGPLFSGYLGHRQNYTGLSALLARNHRLRV